MAKSTYVLIDDVATDHAGTPTEIDNFNRVEYGVVQCKITSTGTVTIQGRTTPNMPWLDIITFTQDDGRRITAFPEMQAVSSGVTGGPVRVEMRF